MIDLPLLMYKHGRMAREKRFEQLILLLAAGGRGMDEESYSKFYSDLTKALAEEVEDDRLDSNALAALRKRITGG